MNTPSRYRLRLVRLLGPLLVIAVLPATAAAQTIVMKVPTTQTLTSCTEGPIVLSGYQTIASHISTDTAGGLHIKFSIENRGLQGVGPTGAKYVGVDTLENEIQIPRGATEFTFVHNLSLVRQGDGGTLLPGDDLRLKELFHLTINAAGTPTAITTEFRTDCT